MKVTFLIKARLKMKHSGATDGKLVAICQATRKSLLVSFVPYWTTLRKT
jgi:hypothetical protein